LENAECGYGCGGYCEEEEEEEEEELYAIADNEAIIESKYSYTVTEGML
jgi:hypothetical protein